MTHTSRNSPFKEAITKGEQQTLYLQNSELKQTVLCKAGPPGVFIIAMKADLCTTHYGVNSPRVLTGNPFSSTFLNVQDDIWAMNVCYFLIS